MAEMPMNEDDLACLNAKMREHPEYRPDMRAVVAEGKTGYSIEGGNLAIEIFKWAKAQLEKLPREQP